MTRSISYPSVASEPDQDIILNKSVSNIVSFIESKNDENKILNSTFKKHNDSLKFKNFKDNYVSPYSVKMLNLKLK